MDPRPNDSTVAGRNPVDALVFEVGGRAFAVDVGAVRGLHRMVAVTPVPGAGAVVNVHGELVPVIAARPRLGLPDRAATADDHLVVAEVGGRPVALHVDRAVELVRLDPAAAGGPTAAGVRVVTRPGVGAGTLVFIHDLRAFLAAGPGGGAA